MEKNKYRITTDGEMFRIELYESRTVRCGWFWLKKVLYEQWSPCDCTGGNCFSEGADGDCWYDDSEIVEYDTIDEAKAKILTWTVPIVGKPVPDPIWSVVWP